MGKGIKYISEKKVKRKKMLLDEKRFCTARFVLKDYSKKWKM
jgi:hypothetical protein